MCVWQAPLIGFVTVTIRSFFKFYWILYCDVMLMMGSQNHGRLIFSLQVLLMVNFRLVPDSHCKGSPRSVGAENKMMNNNQDEVADEFMKIMILIMMTLMVISCKL